MEYQCLKQKNQKVSKNVMDCDGSVMGQTLMVMDVMDVTGYFNR
jgi:hypothetical protein